MLPSGEPTIPAGWDWSSVALPHLLPKRRGRATSGDIKISPTAPAWHDKTTMLITTLFARLVACSCSKGKELQLNPTCRKKRLWRQWDLFSSCGSSAFHYPVQPVQSHSSWSDTLCTEPSTLQHNIKIILPNLIHVFDYSTLGSRRKASWRGIEYQSDKNLMATRVSCESGHGFVKIFYTTVTALSNAEAALQPANSRRAQLCTVRDATGQRFFGRSGRLLLGVVGAVKWNMTLLELSRWGARCWATRDATKRVYKETHGLESGLLINSIPKAIKKKISVWNRQNDWQLNGCGNLLVCFAKCISSLGPQWNLFSSI